MKYFVFGPAYIIRLDPGEKVIETLTALCAREKIGAGVLHGIGTVGEAELGWFDTDAKEYRTTRIREECEIVSLNGNISLLGGKPFVHAHVALGSSSFGVRGGHLREAAVSATAEIVLTRFFDDLERKKAPGSGATVLDLKLDGQ